MTGAQIELSVVVPVYNEAESIASLHAGLDAALSDWRHEIILVDDGSTDASRAEIAKFPAFRCVSIAHAGKSAALDAGIHAARGKTIVTIDADLQEDPSHLSRCWPRWTRAPLSPAVAVPLAWTVFGESGFPRRSTGVCCWPCSAGGSATSIADSEPPVGEVWESVTWFSGAHRLVPLLVALDGGTVAQIPVPHRPRQRGQAKFDSPLRFIDGIRDAFMVRLGRIPRERRMPLQEKTIG